VLDVVGADGELELRELAEKASLKTMAFGVALASVESALSPPALLADTT
jgi:hypothetical protein